MACLPPTACPWWLPPPHSLPLVLAVPRRCLPLPQHHREAQPPGCLQVHPDIEMSAEGLDEVHTYLQSVFHACARPDATVELAMERWCQTAATPFHFEPLSVSIAQMSAIGLTPRWPSARLIHLGRTLGSSTASSADGGGPRTASRS